MRTTVTLDADTEALPKEGAARTGPSVKVVLNHAVKRALARPSTQVRVEPPFAAPFPMELAQQSFNRLAAEWEDEDTVRELSA